MKEKKIESKKTNSGRYRWYFFKYVSARRQVALVFLLTVAVKHRTERAAANGNPLALTGFRERDRETGKHTGKLLFLLVEFVNVVVFFSFVVIIVKSSFLIAPL